MLPRFYLPSLSIQDDTVTIDNKDVIHQLTTVLRLKKNDLFVIFSPQTEYELIIKRITDKEIIASIADKKSSEREPVKNLFLYQSLLKKNKFEWVLQKGTELGVHTFIPIICNNSIVREISSNKLKRYQAIIKEATEQCGGQRLAELKPTIPFKEAVKRAKATPGQKITAWEGQKSNKLGDVLDKKVDEYHLFIGPEGGFTPQEIKLVKANGFILVSLGNRILRAETAATAAMSIIMLS